VNLGLRGEAFTMHDINGSDLWVVAGSFVIRRRASGFADRYT